MPLGREIGLDPSDIVVDGHLAPLSKRGRALPIFGPCLLCPNGCMDQDASWYGGRPRPRTHCSRWGRSSPSQKSSTPPLFGPCLLWPNSWMDQDATWYDGIPRPGQHCVRCGLSSTLQRAQPPNFRPKSIVAKRSPISATAEHLLYT